MKTIYLIRHAKSSWKNTENSDFERPLNKRGKADRKIIGKRLAIENCIPCLFVSSSAKRTKETSIEIAKAIGYNITQIKYMDSLYHASSNVMLSAINNQDNKFENLIMVGHNPGISNLNFQLTGQFISFSTSGISKITFETENWEEIFNDTGYLEFFENPKTLM